MDCDRLLGAGRIDLGLTPRTSIVRQTLVDDPSGLAFERMVMAFYREAGYNVTPTPASGDKGVDFIVRQVVTKTAIQCKRWAAPVGIAAIQEVYAGMKFYECHEAVVICTSSFTPAAKELAQKLGVELIDGSGWSKMLAGLKNDPRPRRSSLLNQHPCLSGERSLTHATSARSWTREDRTKGIHLPFLVRAGIRAAKTAVVRLSGFAKPTSIALAYSAPRVGAATVFQVERTSFRSSGLGTTSSAEGRPATLMMAPTQPARLAPWLSGFLDATLVASIWCPGIARTKVMSAQRVSYSARM